MWCRHCREVWIDIKQGWGGTKGDLEQEASFVFLSNFFPWNSSVTMEKWVELFSGEIEANLKLYKTDENTWECSRITTSWGWGVDNEFYKSPLKSKGTQQSSLTFVQGPTVVCWIQELKTLDRHAKCPKTYPGRIFHKFFYPKCVNYVNLRIATKQQIIQCTITQAG